MAKRIKKNHADRLDYEAGYFQAKVENLLNRGQRISPQEAATLGDRALKLIADLRQQAKARDGRRRKPNAAFAAEYNRLKAADPRAKDRTIARRMTDPARRWLFADDDGYNRFKSRKAACRKAGLI
jgi:hypothetical protein